MFKPEDELNRIHEKIRSDDRILQEMGLKGADSVVIANQIIKRSKYEDMAGSQKRINIYFRPSRTSANHIISNEVLQVDCHVPAKEDFIAWRVISLIKENIHNYQVGSRKYYFSGQLGEIQTMDGFFCAGCRFNFYITI